MLFLPDINLGNYVKQQTGRENMKIWQGACIVHATFPARTADGGAGRASRKRWWRRIRSARRTCWRWPISSARPARSSNGAWPATAAEFIVMTESGVRHSLERLAPEKRFYFVPNENCNCSECPYMRRNTLEKLRDCLADLAPRIELSDEIMRRAALPIERMLAVPG